MFEFLDFKRHSKTTLICETIGSTLGSEVAEILDIPAVSSGELHIVRDSAAGIVMGIAASGLAHAVRSRQDRRNAPDGGLISSSAARELENWVQGSEE